MSADTHPAISPQTTGKIDFIRKLLPDWEIKSEGLAFSQFRDIVGGTPISQVAKYRYVIAEPSNKPNLPEGLYIETNLAADQVSPHTLLELNAINASVLLELAYLSHQSPVVKHLGFNVCDFLGASGNVILKVT